MKVFNLFPLLILLIACESSRPTYTKSNKKWIKLSKDTDTLLIRYNNGNNKITYCQALEYLALSRTDTTLFKYFYTKGNYHHFQTFIGTMSRKTHVEPNWIISFAGGVYLEDYLFYEDVLNWNKVCECTYNDSTILNLLMEKSKQN
jgi:hypothetical protein